MARKLEDFAKEAGVKIHYSYNGLVYCRPTSRAKMSTTNLRRVNCLACKAKLDQAKRLAWIQKHIAK